MNKAFPTHIIFYLLGLVQGWLFVDQVSDLFDAFGRQSSPMLQLPQNAQVTVLPYHVTRANNIISKNSQVKKIILLTSQCSGSTWLSQVLAKNPMTEFASELMISYSLMDEPTWLNQTWESYEKELEEAFQPKHNSTRWIGFKLMYDQLPLQLHAHFATWLNQHGVYVIHLKRNPVLQHASQHQKVIRMTSTGIRLNHITKQNVNVFGNYTDPLLDLNVGRHLQKVRQLQQNHDQFSNFLDVHAPLSPTFTVRYEDLDGPFQDKWMRAINGFLGVEQLAKPNKDTNDEKTLVKYGKKLCEDRVKGLHLLQHDGNSRVMCNKLLVTENNLKGLATTLKWSYYPKIGKRAQLKP